MPKQRGFEFVVDGTPAEVADRLKRRTRFRLMPYQSSPLGRGGLGGRVSASGFRVALDPRGLVQMSQAVAVGELVPEGVGHTRVRGVAGLPDWVTWGLRATFPAIGVAVGAIVVAASGDASIPLWVAGVYGVAATVGSVIGVGWHVANADQQVEPLVDAVRESLGAREAAAQPIGARQTEG
jgi:hypothetical protein